MHVSLAQLCTPPTAVPAGIPDPAAALSQSNFVPFFQPIVALRSGQVAGFEVLARWQHPELGLIPPDRFIPIAERDGWITAVSQQIFRKAFLAAAALPNPLTLAINISPVQLRDTSLPEQLRLLAHETDFPLSRVIIEITESAMIEDLATAASVVAELKAMGCRLALDDFGTGYSSLSNLQALPFDKLKVDRSFVASMAERRESRKIVSAVIGLGQSLGLMTVGEGIETQEQAEMLLWIGCDFGQGYFYGQPMPAEGLDDCLAAKWKKVGAHEGSDWKRVFAADFDSPRTHRLAQLQAVYESAPVGLAFLDQNLRYVNLNQRLADMNGARLEDHLGRSVQEMVPELYPYAEPYLRRALSGEPLLDVELHIPHTDETRLVSYQPVSDEAGEVIGLSLSVIDISDRKRAERALKRSEAHYKKMITMNPHLIRMMDVLEPTTEGRVG